MTSQPDHLIAAMLDYRPGPKDLGYLFGDRAPVAELVPGQLMRVYTEDCFNGLVRSEADLPSKVCRFPYLNPVSGPFHIRGAEPGDTLAVHLLDIVPVHDWAVSATFPHFGTLTSTTHTATLQPPLPERVWRYTIDRAAGRIRYAGGDYEVDLRLRTMLGTIGVAPAASEARSTVVGDTHGGNLDVPQIRPGVTVYLGVNVPGGQLSLGDGHCRQGDGEACGVAVEAAMYVTLMVDVVKGAHTVWPRIESDTHIGSIGAARPLEDAYRVAHHDLVRWIADLHGLDTLDAYQLVGQAGQARIGNVCDPNYTVTARVRKGLVRGPDPYGGVHANLRAAAIRRST